MLVTAQGQAESSSEAALAIHGGAGSMSAEEMSEEKQRTYRTALRTALREGYEILQSGGHALDAVEAAIATMENNPLFNAARGSVLTRGNTVELGASIMDGK